MVEEGTILRRFALKDTAIRPGIFGYQLNKETGAIDENNPGIAIKILDELARRGQFQWRDSYGVLDTPKKDLNQTWGGLLAWTVDTYDIMGDWFLRTTARLGDGIVFPEGWYDGSLIMVRKSAGEETSFTWTSFLQPFTTAVWFLIGGAVLLTGLAYYAVDYIEHMGDTKKLEAGISESMFMATFILTGHCMYRPNSAAKRIMVFSICFLCLLIAAAYTANLASFLVTRNQPAIVINDIQDAIKNDMRFCVLQSSTSETFLTANYPTARLVRKDSIGDTYLALDTDDCDLVLTTVGTWNLKKRDIVYNEDCQKEWVGRVVEFVTAGFSIRDSAELCSSLLRDVLNLHMLEMKLDGTFDTIWETHQKLVTTNNCQDLEDAEAENDMIKLTVSNVGGIFIVHAFAIVFGILITFYSRYRITPTSETSLRKFRVSLQSNLNNGSDKSMTAESTNDPLELVDNIERQESSKELETLYGQGKETSASTTADKVREEMEKQTLFFQQRDIKQMECIEEMKKQLDTMQKDFAVMAAVVSKDAASNIKE
eukprot:CAMPEP_0195283808 /NCGR_PEP_ID=MMETSP0707-20130614/2230_1 /TAXON_ID=33640 /ORGANISM="Asterionellopsis glacialis, Strain CCMP134" /LENGTH=540 /DNA_ID=CAMNT_0040343045 /DNA_START=123 /DNA_END=1745 /DNA_ORIENTATION=+